MTSTADNGEGRYRPCRSTCAIAAEDPQISADIAAARLRLSRLRAKRLTPEDAAATTEQCVRPLIDVQAQIPSAAGSRFGDVGWLVVLALPAGYFPANLHDLAAALVSGLGRAAGGWPTSTCSSTATCPGRLCDRSSRTQASAGRRGRPLSRAELS
jgi:hypothetical protein